MRGTTRTQYSAKGFVADPRQRSNRVIFFGMASLSPLGINHGPKRYIVSHTLFPCIKHVNRIAGPCYQSDRPFRFRWMEWRWPLLDFLFLSSHSTGSAVGGYPTSAVVRELRNFWKIPPFIASVCNSLGNYSAMRSCRISRGRRGKTAHARPTRHYCTCCWRGNSANWTAVAIFYIFRWGFQMIGDDDSCQELVGTKSDEHRACEKTI